MERSYFPRSLHSQEAVEKRHVQLYVPSIPTRVGKFDSVFRRVPGRDLLTLRNVHKAGFSVDMLLLADYTVWVGEGDRTRGETTLLGLDTDFSLVRDTSPCARLNRVVDGQDVLVRSGMNRGIV